jgi:hypothetical protein
MRQLLLIFALWSPLAVFAQSTLPSCPADVKERWHNCIGTRKLPHGAKYVGDFRDGKPHGQGTTTGPNSRKYVGEFREGKEYGRGTITSSGGLRYEGEVRDGKPHGQGVTTGPGGFKFVGDFLEGMPHGQGTLTSPDYEYRGEFRGGKYHGRGIQTFSDGRKFVGEFREGWPNGEGVHYLADGSVSESGKWKDSRIESAYALDPKLFPFDAALGDAGRAERDRLIAQAKERERIVQVAPRPEPAVARARPEHRVALIIGNAAYKTGPLSNPVNDATDISAALRGLGFEVTTLRDATLSQMRVATRKFEEAVRSADVALIFYAGHGIEANGRNYMVPVGANIAREFELEDQAYDAGQWLAMLEGAKGPNSQRVNIVILDACRDNPLSRQWRTSGRGLGRMDAPSGTVLVYSTAPGKVAADGPPGQRNSPFTKGLLKSMRQPNLPIEQVLKEVRRQVLAETKGEQVPWESSSLVGDFVFRRGR